MERDADAPLLRVHQKAGALVTDLELARVDARRRAAPVRQLHRVDGRVVPRQLHGALVQRRQLRVAPARRRKRLRRGAEDCVLVDQVREAADGRRRVRVTLELQRDVRERRVVEPNRRRVHRRRRRVRLRAEHAAGPGLFRGEHLTKVRVVLDHRPGHQVFGFKRLREAPQELARIRERAALQSAERGVAHRRVVHDARPLVPLRRDRRSRDVDHEPQRDGVARDALVQRKLAVRQLRRQHGHARPGRVVDAGIVRRRAALPRPLEERRAHADAARDVCDVDAESDRVRVDDVERDCVVDVARARVVDAHQPRRRRVGARSHCVHVHEAPVADDRVLAGLDAEVKLHGEELRGVLARRAEELDELRARLRIAGVDRDLHFGPLVPLGLRLAVGDPALAAAEEDRRRDARLAVAVAVVELEDGDAHLHAARRR
mmetsp:Transcript_28262/g.95171  ORF Transcript_28262/g.95171 Transcript_28262/m.95171 type:complete len:432 (+) Transcript_28262:819-2114(+)